MTVILAIQESDDSILIGADSCEINAALLTRTVCLNKLQRHPSAPLVYGLSGNPTIGIEWFGHWFREYPWPPSDWIAFQQEAGLKLSQLNGKQREIIKAAGRDASPDELATVLIAGWLDTPMIFEIDENGIITIPDKAQGLHGIGSGASYSKIIDYTLRTVKYPAGPFETFRLILRIAIHLVPNCFQPAHIWRINRNGVTVIEGPDLSES